VTHDSMDFYAIYRDRAGIDTRIDTGRFDGMARRRGLVRRVLGTLLVDTGRALSGAGERLMTTRVDRAAA